MRRDKYCRGTHRGCTRQGRAGSHAHAARCEMVHMDGCVCQDIRATCNARVNVTSSLDHGKGALANREPDFCRRPRTHMHTSHTPHTHTPQAHAREHPARAVSRVSSRFREQQRS